MTPSTADHSNQSKQAAAGANQQQQPDPLVVGEIRPGLWIGSLQSIRELPKIGSGSSSSSLSWTVISILKSEKLLKFARDALAEISSGGDKGDNTTTNQQSNNTNIQHSNSVTIGQHLEWELQDHAKADFLSNSLDEILTAMDQHSSGSPCLVHCAFGVSRSATVCAAWLLTRRKAPTLPVALNEIRKVRPGIEVNMGFVACLRALQECQGDVDAARKRLYPSSSSCEQEEEEDRISTES